VDLFISLSIRDLNKEITLRRPFHSLSIKPRTIYITLILLLFSAGFAVSQIQEGYIVGDIWSKNFRPISKDTPSTINSQSRANYIKSKLQGHLGLDGSGITVGLHDQSYQGETHVDLKGRHRIATFGISGGITGVYGNFVAGTTGEMATGIHAMKGSPQKRWFIRT
jgi:hypothetical protein